MVCPFCARENVANALVCGSCSRDVAVPPALLAERDDLVQKRDHARRELADITIALERFRNDQKRRSV